MKILILKIEENGNLGGYKYISQNKLEKTNMLLEPCKGEKHTYINISILIFKIIIIFALFLE